MRLLPRTPRGTWLLAAAAWAGLCALAWWLLPPRPRAVLDGEFEPWAVRFSALGRWVTMTPASPDGQTQPLQIRDVGTGSSAVRLPGEPPRSSSVFFSPDDHWLLAGNHMAGVGVCACGLYDTVTGAGYEAPPDLCTWSEQGFCFSPAGDLLACAGETTDAWHTALLAVPSFQKVARLAEAVPPFSFSPDGRFLATGLQRSVHDAPEAAVWEVATARIVARVSLPRLHTPVGFVLRPDGRFVIATTFWPNTFTACSVVQVWDVGSGRKVAEQSGASHVISAADEPLVLRGKNDGTNDSQAQIDVVDVMAGSTRCGISSNAALDVAWNHGGQSGGRMLALEELVQSPVDRFIERYDLPWAERFRLSRPTIAIYDLHSGRRLGRVGLVDASALPLLAPDGQTLAVWQPGSIELWDIPPRKPPAWFAAAAAVLALPLAGLAWWRTRRLRREMA
ncbi:MAG TPA: hypothetical protein VGF55_17110 [Gemmataceae bacterium]|jgi:WD40 repeat protein